MQGRVHAKGAYSWTVKMKKTPKSTPTTTVRSRSRSKNGENEPGLNSPKAAPQKISVAARTPGSPKAKPSSTRIEPPSSPIASASPKARRIRVQAHAESSQQPTRVSARGTKATATNGSKDKKTLFSPKYTLDDDKQESTTRKSSRKGGTRTPPPHKKAVITPPSEPATPEPEPESVEVVVVEEAQDEQYVFDEDEFDPFVFIKNLPLYQRNGNSDLVHFLKRNRMLLVFLSP